MLSKFTSLIVIENVMHDKITAKLKIWNYENNFYLQRCNFDSL